MNIALTDLRVRNFSEDEFGSDEEMETKEEDEEEDEEEETEEETL